MHYVIHCLDGSDVAAARHEHHAAHRAYLTATPVKIVISGPLVAEDGETSVGSFFLIEAEAIEDALAFHRNDPFAAAKVWEKVEIHTFLKRMDNRG